MKVAIITYHRAYNYGSALQSYALNTFLCDHGYETETIDYRTQRQKNIYRLFEPGKGFLPIIRNTQSLLHFFALKKRKARFDHFIDNNISVTKTYTHKEQLSELKDSYDGYICGSDQIWNPHCTDFDESYLLEFVEKKHKCISYAPSIACSELPEEWHDRYKTCLTGFSAISVREQAGASILNNLLDRNIQAVLDPVFLLPKNIWNTLAVPVRKKPYILCYFIGDVEGMRSFARKMKKQLHLPLVVVYKNIRDMLYLNHKEYAAGPKEFLGLIRGAEYVCTNSLHAVAFSAIYEKNFWVFVDKDNPKSAKSRIQHIANLLGLNHRVLTAQNMNTIEIDKPINFCECREKLNREITASKKYLLTNLQKIGDRSGGSL